MAVKRRKQKKWNRLKLDIKLVKIKCYKCLLKNECKYRKDKEILENQGIITYCIYPPVKKLYMPRWWKLDKNGDIINLNKNMIGKNRLFNGGHANDNKQNRLGQTNKKQANRNRRNNRLWDNNR